MDRFDKVKVEEFKQALENWIDGMIQRQEEVSFIIVEIGSSLLFLSLPPADTTYSCALLYFLNASFLRRS